MPSPACDTRSHTSGNDSDLRCLGCEYNLTGLTSDTCPECGQPIDWDLVRTDPELRRAGTPVYHVYGWRVAPAVVQTVLMLLLMPWRFASRARVDDPLRPPLALAVVSVLTYHYWIPWGGWRPIAKFAVSSAVLAASLAMLVLTYAGVLATCSAPGLSRLWTWRVRFRTWMITALYSTVFVAIWPLFAPIWPLSRRDLTLDWPVVMPFRHDDFAAMLIVLWWSAILGICLLVRHRPRWLAIVLVLIAFAFVRLCIQAADILVFRLAR